MATAGLPMNLAIHQPYLFPYLGYFQLIHSVDTFVLFDEVTFRKQGWINRNRIMINGLPQYFSVPLRRASSSRPINQTLIDQQLFPEWRRKFLRTLAETYSGAATRDTVLALVTEALDTNRPDIASLAERSVKVCCRYFGLQPRLLPSSTSFAPSGQKGVARVIEICRAAGATAYINAPGGRDLYDAATFAQAGVTLRFLKPELAEYPQPAETFVSGLSVIDLLMRLSQDAARLAVRRGSVE